MDDARFVDVAFPARGGEIPADHAAEVYGAVCRVAPELHGADGMGIFPVRGLHLPGRRLRLTEASRLRIRLPAECIGQVLVLAGKRLSIDDRSVSLGTPSVRLLEPCADMQSRLVIIKGFMEKEPFLDAVRRQLVALECDGTASTPEVTGARSFEGGETRELGDPLRRTLSIHGREIVGFAVHVTGLSANSSLRLQARGIGGRRRYGCGLFTPLPET